MSHIFDSKLHQSEFYVYENYVVYLHVYHVGSYSLTPTYKQPLYGCQPDEPQASLATTNRCNRVYVVLFFILLLMYAVIHCLYSVGNKITTTTTTFVIRIVFERGDILDSNFIATCLQGSVPISNNICSDNSFDAHIWQDEAERRSLILINAG